MYRIPGASNRKALSLPHIDNPPRPIRKTEPQTLTSLNVPLQYRRRQIRLHLQADHRATPPKPPHLANLAPDLIETINAFAPFNLNNKHVAQGGVEGRSA